MYRGTTPTFIFKTSAEIDLTRAKNIYVTFSDWEDTELFTKTGEDLVVETQTIGAYLTQTETLSLPAGRIHAQINWTYEGGKRMCSNIISIASHTNLLNSVVE